MIFKKRFAYLTLWLGIGLLFLGCAEDIAPSHAEDAVQDWNKTQLSRMDSSESEPFSFAVLGDAQSSSAIFAHHLARIRRAGDFDFVVSVGDQVASPKPAEFKKFFRLAEKVVDRPLLTVKGNHDDSTDHLYERFCGAPYYSFQYKGSYFIVLDDANLTGLGDEQWRWLESELRAARNFKSRLVFMHAPPFDPRDPRIEKNDHGLPEAEGRRIVKLFKDYHVDHVFSGHIHSYYDDEWDGVPYTISGGGGAPLVGRDPEHSFHHFLRVRVAGNGAVEVVPQRIPLAGIPVVGVLTSKAWASFDGMMQMLGNKGFMIASMALVSVGDTRH